MTLIEKSDSSSPFARGFELAPWRCWDCSRGYVIIWDRPSRREPGATEQGLLGPDGNTTSRLAVSGGWGQPPLLDVRCVECGFPAHADAVDELVRRVIAVQQLSAPSAPQTVVKSGRTDRRLMVPLREAVRLLGVDRPVLYAWIDDGRIRVVEVNGRRRIPRSEIDRIARDGLGTAAARNRAKGRRSTKPRSKTAVAGSPGAAIRALKL